MAQSGVIVNDDCVTSFNDIKLKHDKKFIIFKISDDSKRIEIESTGDKDKTFDEFTTILKGLNEPRYAVIDFYYTTEDGRPQEKLCFVFWSPDTSPVKKKMLYAASKDAIKKPLTGIHAELQCADAADLDKKEFEDKCKR